jgi:hypothetical protein
MQRASLNGRITGAVLAVETRAVGRASHMEKSDILAPMNKQMLELFSGRAGSEGVTARMEGLIEGEEDKKKRKKEQKARDAAEGKRHGKLHDLKETRGN